ncbi:DMT family transporter [Draconibacterium sediminis]|uniref:DMT family transporter n=1 Tax=Draconibacterium sediminis TaxID=1544798 RepID=UPI0026F0C2E9|nr:DMT family transporter [Draconibacterium sediminis]
MLFEIFLQLKNNKKFEVMRRGVFLAIIAAVCWGVSGTLGQFLFQQKGVNVEWLITIRLLISGLCLLIFAHVTNKDVFNIWKNRKDAIQLIVFSIIGMLGVQYTYFAAIKHSNAATATILQFSGPIMIALYLAIKNKKIPNTIEIIAIILAVTGTFLLVTHGSLGSLAITPLALFLGLSSAITLAFYSLQPKELLEKYHSAVVIGWGILMAGFIFSFVKAPWETKRYCDIETFASIAFIIFLGSLAAFYSYLSATKIIGAQKTSLLTSTEPLVACLLSVTWLKTPFSLIDWGASLCIISTVFLLSAKNK